MKLRYLTYLLSLALCGCGSDDGDGGGGSGEIASHELSGKIAGQSWNVAHAETDPFFDDDEELWVDLYGQPATEACGSNEPDGSKLILSVPRRAGEYPLSLQRNGTFVIQTTDGTDNLVGTEGSLRVDEVTSTTLRGGVSIEYDADNSVSGVFEVTICAE
jgi:hypothetical protein